jgi:phosphoribosylformylglycinamidine cyclo-ligase
VRQRTGNSEQEERVSFMVDYKSAGVDIEAGNEAVRRMKSHVVKTHSKAVLKGLGSFGTMYSLGDALRGMTDPVMVQSTDGVGTKTKVTVMAAEAAAAAGGDAGKYYELLGRDLVAAVAGDIAVMGARPLTFLDYLGLHKTEPSIVERLVKGMSEACAEAGIALVGGETAEMPAVYSPGELDVVGFVTGVVERSEVITGAEIVEGDVLYGVGSTGLHTNGWSLARKLLFEMNGFAIHEAMGELDGKTLADVLLVPHGNYVKPIRRALDAGIEIKGMAHITGGGLVENVPRVLPEGMGAVIDMKSWRPQPIFGLMQRLGSIDAVEMNRAFNMGVGLVVIGAAGLEEKLAEAMKPFAVWELGRVVSGVEGVVLDGVSA